MSWNFLNKSRTRCEERAAYMGKIKYIYISIIWGAKHQKFWKGFICTNFMHFFFFFFFFLFIIIISFFYSLRSIGHPCRDSKPCDLQLSPWPHSIIFLYFLFRPLLSFAAFSSAYLFFYIPEDSNPVQFSLLLMLLYVMCVLSNSIFFFLSEFLLVSAWWFSIVLHL